MVRLENGGIILIKGGGEKERVESGM